MRIAIMQPYFIPYAGYFRLFQSVDLFVVYDCIQFARRGYVHRNQLPNFTDELSWITLPLAKAPQNIKISELTFAQDAHLRMKEQLRKFPLFSKQNYLDSEFCQMMSNFSGHPTQYILDFLTFICRSLQIPCHFVKSSELQLPADLKGQDRIISIAQHFKASTYVNAPGGRDLYDEKCFKQHRLTLKFLSPYKGSQQSILSRILSEDIPELKKEITSQSLES